MENHVVSAAEFAARALKVENAEVSVKTSRKSYKEVHSLFRRLMSRRPLFGVSDSMLDEREEASLHNYMKWVAWKIKECHLLDNEEVASLFKEATEGLFTLEEVIEEGRLETLQAIEARQASRKDRESRRMKRTLQPSKSWRDYNPGR